MEHELASLVGVVARTIDRHAMIVRGDRVLVAASGGADSAGLALLLVEMRSRLGCELVVAHVHHGLRGEEADRSEAAAAAVAAALDLLFVRCDVRIEGDDNLEARARAARYRALHELADEHHCDRIATGHTRDDQAETFLLRALRGAGADGLAGIHPVRADGVVRPLLDCDRERIARVVDRRGLAVVDDSMNRDPRFLRSRIRHEVLPLLRELNPAAGSSLAAASDASRGAAAAQRLWAESVGVGRDELDEAVLSALPAELRTALLREWLRRVVPQAQVSSRLIGEVERLAGAGGAGTAIDLTPGWRIERRDGHLVAAERAVAEPFEPRPLEIGGALRLPGGWELIAERADVGVDLPKDLWTAVVDLDRCGGLAVRSPRPGDRVRPLGMSGRKKLAEVFGARRVPRPVRAGYPVVVSGEELLWVPGVVRGAASALRPGTARVAVLRAARLTVAGHKGP